jgi:hypothetical protein
LRLSELTEAREQAGRAGPRLLPSGTAYEVP